METKTDERINNDPLTRVWQKWRFSAPQTHLWLIKVWFSASTFVVKFATFAKPETVSGNGIATLYKPTMTKFLLTFSTIILFVLTILFAWTFVNRWTIPFNSEGNYFDENTSVVYHEQSVLIYGLITISLLLFTALTGFFARKKFKIK